MNIAYAHEQAYPHMHPHDHVNKSTDLFATIVWFAVMIALCRLVYKFALKHDARAKSKGKRP